jgi:hypothetical protein
MLFKENTGRNWIFVVDYVLDRNALPKMANRKRLEDIYRYHDDIYRYNSINEYFSLLNGGLCTT